MEMRILSIIIWPKDPSKNYRKIDLEIDRINVITGQSHTGKSALIPIIDYCLGSGRCAIPVGVIRDKTAWFGLLLQFEKTQMLIARPEPGDKDQTTDMYMDEAETVEITDRPGKTCNVDAFKNRLNQIAGLPSLDFNTEGKSDSSFKNRPSMRDMSAFEFQPQHIIANPYTLFFKADTYEHREKLKTIFPFVLGVVTNEMLALKHELKDLRKEFERKKEELDLRKSAANTWIAEIKASYSQARELGLLKESPDPQQDWDINDYVQYLQDIPKQSEIDIPQIDIGSTERAVKELNALRNEEHDTSRQIGALRYKLSKIEQLSDSEEQYGNALTLQKERLRSVGWFEDKIKDKNNCPFCGSTSHSAAKEVENLLKVTKDILRASKSTTNAQDVLDKEIANIRKQLRILESRLNIIRDHRRLIESKSEDLRAKRQTLNEVYRFVGRFEQSLENYSITQQDSQLVEELTRLGSRISYLESKLSSSDEENRRRAALDYISKNISIYAKCIGAERFEDPVHLDLTNLTVRISSRGKSNEDYLWEIGSGANWMGYHISTLLALHQYFLSLESCPVPNFLVIDQPSQVYFPERWPHDLDPKNPNNQPYEPNSGDIECVHKIFRTLSEGLVRMDNKLQLLVIEHADEMTWRGIENINLVERWRNGKALIPLDW